jgi:hypothetical protein
MDEKNYYKAQIKEDFEDAKGRLKKRSESYIVEAISPTDVEAKIAKHMEGSVTDYTISSIVVTNIVDILR